MPIDINLLRPERGKPTQSLFSFIFNHNFYFVFITGGDPDKVKASQRARFADESVVDQIMELDAQRRTGKYSVIWLLLKRIKLEC